MYDFVLPHQVAAADEQLLFRRVVAACRNPDKSDGLKELQQQHSGNLSTVILDVTDEDSITVSFPKLSTPACRAYSAVRCPRTASSGTVNKFTFQNSRKATIWPAFLIR